MRITIKRDTTVTCDFQISRPKNPLCRRQQICESRTADWPIFVPRHLPLPRTRVVPSRELGYLRAASPKRKRGPAVPRSVEEAVAIGTWESPPLAVSWCMRWNDIRIMLISFSQIFIKDSRSVFSIRKKITSARHLPSWSSILSINCAIGSENARQRGQKRQIW